MIRLYNQAQMESADFCCIFFTLILGESLQKWVLNRVDITKVLLVPESIIKNI